VTGKGATFGERMAAAGQGVKSGFTGSSLLEGDPSAQRPNKLAQLMGAEDVNVPDIVDQSAPLGTTTTQPGLQTSGAITSAGTPPPDLSGGAVPSLDASSIDAASDLARVKETMGASTMYEPATSTAIPASTDATATLANLKATAQTPSLSERFTNVVTDQGDGFLTDTKELFFPSKPTTEQVMRAELATEGINAGGQKWARAKENLSTSRWNGCLFKRSFEKI